MNRSGDEELCGIPAIFKVADDFEPPVKRSKILEEQSLQDLGLDHEQVEGFYTITFLIFFYLYLNKVFTAFY